MEELNKRLGERIKKIRKARKMTQAKLAERSNLSVEYISRLERGIGHPSFKTLTAIANALEVDMKDFFDFNAPIKLEKDEDHLNKADYIRAIMMELKDMEVKELTEIYRIIQILTGKHS